MASVVDNEYRAVCGMRIGRGENSEKTFPGANFSDTNSTWADMGSNLATNRLSYGTAHIRSQPIIFIWEPCDYVKDKGYSSNLGHYMRSMKYIQGILERARRGTYKSQRSDAC
jgi:hypothetical protein